MKKIYGTAVWICLLVSAWAHASSTTEGWRAFGGIGLGYGGVSGNEFKSAPQGGHYLLNAQLGHQFRKWVAEAGAGWFYSTLNGEDMTGARDVNIKTRSGLADLSIRYRLTERWQLGPALEMAFGTDTSQAPSIGISGSNLRGGLRSAYEMPMGGFPFRVWQQLSTDLSVSGRNHLIAMVGVQIGFPIRAHRSQEDIQTDVLPQAQAAPEKTHDVRIVLDPQRVFFNTNSSQLKPDIALALHEVGDYLRAHPQEWSEVTIAGHADQRGRFEYNLTLSQKRAHQVFAAIDESSVSDSLEPRIKVEAHSFSQPVDERVGPKAWAKNRRVELVFLDVRRPQDLIKKLEPLTDHKPVID